MYIARLLISLNSVLAGCARFCFCVCVWGGGGRPPPPPPPPPGGRGYVNSPGSAGLNSKPEFFTWSKSAATIVLNKWLKVVVHGRRFILFHIIFVGSEWRIRLLEELAKPQNVLWHFLSSIRSFSLSLSLSLSLSFSLSLALSLSLSLSLSLLVFMWSLTGPSVLKWNIYVNDRINVTYVKHWRRHLAV